MLNNGTFILSALNAGHSLGISGSITNNGVIQVNPGPISQFSGEGSRSFGGSITNSGLININAPTFVFGSLSNSGTVSVASGRSLLLSGSFFLTSGSLAAAGTVTTPTFSYTG